MRPLMFFATVVIVMGTFILTHPSNKKIISKTKATSEKLAVTIVDTNEEPYKSSMVKEISRKGIVIKNRLFYKAVYLSFKGEHRRIAVAGLGMVWIIV